MQIQLGIQNITSSEDKKCSFQKLDFLSDYLYPCTRMNIRIWIATIDMKLLLQLLSEVQSMDIFFQSNYIRVYLYRIKTSLLHAIKFIIF